MREIEFRAVAKNKKRWVYGDLIHDGTGYSIIEDSGYGCIKVKPETLGQYTGLKDKNGTKIFEGDIVKTVTIDEKETRYGVVKFGKYKDINFEDSCCGFYVELEEIQCSIFNGEADGYCLLDMVEVAGNIYDNPELLEEQNGNIKKSPRRTYQAKCNDLHN